MYYKATRLDGTDFYSGTVLYEVGKRTTHPTSKLPRKNDPRSYLSVSTTPTDCTGFVWPCRLFWVRGVGQPMTHPTLPNKRAFLAVDVVEELPAHEVFGPQGEQVVAFLERAKRLTESELRDLDEARYVTWNAAWDAAGAALDAVRESRYAAWDAAENAAGAAWDAARASRYAAGNAVGDATLTATGCTTPAVGEAAIALVVRDLIGSHGFTQAHYDTLTGPWRRVIGPVHPDDEALEKP